MSFMSKRETAAAKPEASAKPADAQTQNDAPPAQQKPAEAKPEAKPEAPKKEKPSFDFQKKEAKTEAKPDEAAKPAEQPKDKDYNWKQVNQERDSLKARVAELETKLKTPQMDESTKKVYEKLDAENKQLKEIVNRVALRESPEFKERFDKSIERFANLARTHVPADLQDQVAKVFREGKFGDDLQAIIDQVDPSAASRLRALEARVNETTFERDEVLANSSKHYEQYAAQQAQQRAQQIEAEKKQASEMFNSAWDSAVDTLELLKADPGNPEQVATVSEIKDLASNIWNGQMEAKELAKVSVWAALAPRYREALYAQMETNAKLQQEIATLKGAKPNPTSGSSGAIKAGDSGLSIEDKFNKLMAS